MTRQVELMEPCSAASSIFAQMVCLYLSNETELGFKAKSIIS